LESEYRVLAFDFMSKRMLFSIDWESILFCWWLVLEMPFF